MLLTAFSRSSDVDPALCTLSMETIVVQEFGEVCTNATSSGLPVSDSELPFTAPIPTLKLNNPGNPSHATSTSLVCQG